MITHLKCVQVYLLLPFARKHTQNISSQGKLNSEPHQLQQKSTQSRQHHRARVFTAHTHRVCVLFALMMMNSLCWMRIIQKFEILKNSEESVDMTFASFSEFLTPKKHSPALLLRYLLRLLFSFNLRKILLSLSLAWEWLCCVCFEYNGMCKEIQEISFTCSGFFTRKRRRRRRLEPFCWNVWSTKSLKFVHVITNSLVSFSLHSSFFV